MTVADGLPRTDSETTGSRLSWVSLVRVLGILGVVLIHVSGLTYARAAQDGSFAQLAAGVLDFSQNWAVPGFVMASGATLLGRRAGDAGSFLRQRLGRIVFPLVFWHAAYILFTRVELGYDAAPAAIAAPLLQGRTYTALYFFWLILGLYLVAPMLQPFLARLPVRSRWMAAAALTIWAGAALSIDKTLDVLAVAPAGARMNVATIFVPYLGFFVAGLALRDTPIASRWILPTFLVAIGAGSLTVAQRMGLGGGGVVGVLAPPAYYGLGNAAYSLAVVVLLKAFAERSRWLQTGRFAEALDRWGRRTLGIFAVHLLVLYVAQRATDNWPQGAGTLTGMLALFAMTVVGSALLTLVMERLPVLRGVV